ncbi:uncharacterized protein [Chironomus tepperi]|uniref:uncharacterized protein n=1 Tax=Chironomus tepperi TaxID=113505 RepID=UPI00391F6F22
MSHQIKINLETENSASQQPIIISWTNPSTDSTSQLVNIKQEDELHIISQIIQEVPHPASKKSTEIVSPTRVLRSHGKAAVAVAVKAPPKSKRNSKSQPAEMSKKVVDRSSKSMDMSPTNGHSSPWITTVKRKNSKSQAKSNKVQVIEGHLGPKVSKKLVKILPKVDDHEKSIDESLKEPIKVVTPKSAPKAAQQSKDDLLNEPTKLQNSKSALKVTQMSIESLQERAKLINSKSAAKTTQKSNEDLLKEPAKLPKSKSASKATNKPKASKASRKRQLKKDKNGNSLKIDNSCSLVSNNSSISNHSQPSSVLEAANDIKIDETHIKKEEELDIAMEIDDKSELTSQIVQKSTIPNHSQSYSPMEVTVDLKMNEKYIKEEMELDIVTEIEDKGELAPDSHQIVKKSIISSLSQSSSIMEVAIDPKIDENHIKKEEELDIAMENDIKPELTPDLSQTDQKVIQIEYIGSLAVNNPQNSSDSAFLPIKDAATVKVEAIIKDEPTIKHEPVIKHKPTIKSEAIDEITVKVIKIDPKTAIKPEPTDLTTSSTSSNLETTSSPLKYFKIESSPSKSYNSAPVVQHDMKFTPLSNFISDNQVPKCQESSKYEDDSDDDDRLIIKEDDVETIDISDTDDEKPDESTPKKFQNSWTNLTNQSLTSTDSNSLTSSNHVSISYPSIDGSTSLQPPVIQFSYQFPMDSQHSASSTQIQKHFMSSAMEPIHKNLGQQSTFGQLFTNGVQSSSKLSVMDRSKVNVSPHPSTSQVGVASTSNKPQSSKNSSKITSDSHKIPIIPYIPSAVPSRRMSTTSSDGSSSTSHPFQCKMCMAIFKRKIDMIHHLKSHSEAKFECQRCGMKFKFEGYFSKHECIACELCDKTFVLKQQLRNHQRIEHDIQMEMYECDLCGKKLRYRHGVLYHMSKTHMKYLEDKYECDICGKRFKLKESIRLHVKNHESVIECKLCDKKVKRINLNVHMKSVHVTERKFKCRICRTTFKTKECLKSHIRTHEKSFECTECGKRFSNKSHLKEHMEWHRNPEAYKCKICHKAFAQKYCLKAHIKLHESGHLFPKFKCSSCPYSTDKTENLEKHEMKHKRQEENEEMRKNWLKCEKCPVKLKNKLKLATHYWKKHSEVMPK